MKRKKKMRRRMGKMRAGWASPQHELASAGRVRAKLLLFLVIKRRIHFIQLTTAQSSGDDMNFTKDRKVINTSP